MEFSMDLIARFVWQINKNGQAYIARNLKEFNIGTGQFPLLMLLFSYKENLNQDEISRLLNFDKGATAKSVSKLLKEGYIERKSDSNDKRMLRISLTKKAHKLKEKFFFIAEEWQNILLTGLSETEIANTFQIMKKLANNSFYNVNPDSISKEEKSK
jgi:DNA-binding MarR family transcriptional regulator